MAAKVEDVAKAVEDAATVLEDAAGGGLASLPVAYSTQRSHFLELVSGLAPLQRKNSCRSVQGVRWGVAGRSMPMLCNWSPTLLYKQHSN